MEYTYPMIAIFKCGYTVEVNNSSELRQLVKKYGSFGYEWLETCFSRNYCYKPFVETYPKDYVPRYFTAYYYEWIVRDFYGIKVDYALVEFDEKPYRAWWSTGRREAQAEAAEKGLPIPYVGRRRRFGRKKYKKNGGKAAARRNTQDNQIFIKNKKFGEFE